MGPHFLFLVANQAMQIILGSICEKQLLPVSTLPANDDASVRMFHEREQIVLMSFNGAERPLPHVRALASSSAKLKI